MGKYIVKTGQTCNVFQSFEISADSQEEAEQLVLKGEGEELGDEMEWESLSDIEIEDVEDVY